MKQAMELTQILWDYLCIQQPLKKADVIIGFGCYNEDIPRQAAELYREGYAPWVMFTGALGRNTSTMWQESEAERFARIAMEAGVPREAILLEDRATNSGENLIFSWQLLQERGIRADTVIGIQKPYMLRRLAAAFPVYWSGPEVMVTCPRQSMAEYMAGVHRFGRTPEETIHMIVGDFQRIPIYAERGYQLPQEIPDDVWTAFHRLVEMGYTDQLI